MPPELDHLTNPYIGPRAFQYGEQIYGREHETGKLVNLIVAERIVLLYSPSGAGKTSLIQAALIPRMAKMKFQVLPMVRISQASPETFDGNGSVNRYVFSTLLSLEEGLPETQQIEQNRLKSMNLAYKVNKTEIFLTFGRSLPDVPPPGIDFPHWTQT